MKKPKGFFTYFHHRALLEHLSDTEAGRLYKALLKYGSTGEMPDFSDNSNCELGFIILKEELEHNFELYAQTCKARSEAGKKGGRPRKKAQRDISDE